MARHQGPVLVDTNVIIECWRIGAWRALAGGYRVETVEDCVTETQTGFQRRRTEERIDRGELIKSLAAVNEPTQRARAELALRIGGIALDPGEEALWAHALAREDAWVLCGPDKASLRCGIRLGLRDRLAPLEALLADAGFRAKGLRDAFTAAWHRATVEELAMAERQERR